MYERSVRSRRWIKTLVVLALLAVVGVFVMFSGIYSVAATRPHSRIMQWMLATAAVQSIRLQARRDKGVDLPDDEKSLRNGYASYDSMCVPCHGGPGVPPDLQEVVKNRKPEEIYWVIKNGIKDAGMPAAGPSHDERDIRELTAFVMKLGTMSTTDYDGFQKAVGLNDDQRP